MGKIGAAYRRSAGARIVSTVRRWLSVTPPLTPSSPIIRSRMPLADHHLRQIAAASIAHHGEQPLITIPAVRFQTDAAGDHPEAKMKTLIALVLVVTVIGLAIAPAAAISLNEA
jgi:hypothetical protein